MANTNRRRDGNRPGPPPAIDRVQQKASYRQTARGQRVDPPGARLGQGPTPDAKIRQRVLNRNQDARRNMRERRGASGPPEMGLSEGFMAEGTGMPRRERPIGTPPGQPAPPPRRVATTGGLHGPDLFGPVRGRGGDPRARRDVGGASRPEVSPEGKIQEDQEFRGLPRATQVEIEKGRMSLDEALGRPSQRRLRTFDRLAARMGLTEEQMADPQFQMARLGPTASKEQQMGIMEAALSAQRGDRAGAAGEVAQPTVQEDAVMEDIEEAVGVSPAGVEEAPVASAEVATSPTLPQGAEGADQVRTAAAQEIAAGGLPAPPGEVDAQGDFRPSPGISEQEAASSIQAQTEAVMQQQPEPPMPKSSLGADSPIEQADSKQKLRSGTRHHIREIGMQTAGMDPKSAKELERKAVRDFDLFGEYPGMDDPHSPPPPIRPGKNSFNPMTGQWVTPEGQVSVLDRMAPSKARGPDTVMTADAVRKGEVR